jgi:hypothetical protein
MCLNHFQFRMLWNKKELYCHTFQSYFRITHQKITPSPKNNEGIKLNAIHHLLVHADDVNSLVDNVIFYCVLEQFFAVCFTSVLSHLYTTAVWNSLLASHNMYCLATCKLSLPTDRITLSPLASQQRLCTSYISRIVHHKHQRWGTLSFWKVQ